MTNVEQPLKTMEPDGFLSESHMNTIKRFDQFWTTTDPNGYLTQMSLKDHPRLFVLALAPV